jgi:hypothetical protein
MGALTYDRSNHIPLFATKDKCPAEGHDTRTAIVPTMSIGFSIASIHPCVKTSSTKINNKNVKFTHTPFACDRPQLNRAEA